MSAGHCLGMRQMGRKERLRSGGAKSSREMCLRCAGSEGGLLLLCCALCWGYDGVRQHVLSWVHAVWPKQIR
jgi:hypothetical protein